MSIRLLLLTDGGGDTRRLFHRITDDRGDHAGMEFSHGITLIGIQRDDVHSPGSGVDRGGRSLGGFFLHHNVLGDMRRDGFFLGSGSPILHRDDDRLFRVSRLSSRSFHHDGGDDLLSGRRQTHIQMGKSWIRLLTVGYLFFGDLPITGDQISHLRNGSIGHVQCGIKEIHTPVAEAIVDLDPIDIGLAFRVGSLGKIVELVQGGPELGHEHGSHHPLDGEFPADGVRHDELGHHSTPEGRLFLVQKQPFLLVVGKEPIAQLDERLHPEIELQFIGVVVEITERSLFPGKDRGIEDLTLVAESDRPDDCADDVSRLDQGIAHEARHLVAVDFPDTQLIEEKRHEREHPGIADENLVAGQDDHVLGPKFSDLDAFAVLEDDRGGFDAVDQDGPIKLRAIHDTGVSLKPIVLVLFVEHVMGQVDVREILHVSSHLLQEEILGDVDQSEAAGGIGIGLHDVAPFYKKLLIDTC